MTKPTAFSLQRPNRYLNFQRLAVERKRRLVERTIDAMRAGAVLHLTYGRERSWWSLSGGSPVPTDVALAVINHPSVISDDGLFGDLPGQTWRFLKTRENSR